MIGVPVEARIETWDNERRWERRERPSDESGPLSVEHALQTYVLLRQMNYRGELHSYREIQTTTAPLGETRVLASVLTVRWCVRPGLWHEMQIHGTAALETDGGDSGDSGDNGDNGDNDSERNDK